MVDPDQSPEIFVMHFLNATILDFRLALIFIFLSTTVILFKSSIQLLPILNICQPDKGGNYLKKPNSFNTFY
ncbi:hypothetical protein AB669_03785 [Pedobacter sp. BMA]|nr:hypothetical protein AB669_03785 [Pedobacter sp. BMA]